jgi:hypothetical protein
VTFWNVCGYETLGEHHVGDSHDSQSCEGFQMEHKLEVGSAAEISLMLRERNSRHPRKKSGPRMSQSQN